MEMIEWYITIFLFGMLIGLIVGMTRMIFYYHKKINFWIEYHKKYSKYHKLPVEHILLILNKLKESNKEYYHD